MLGVEDKLTALDFDMAASTRLLHFDLEMQRILAAQIIQFLNESFKVDGNTVTPVSNSPYPAGWDASKAQKW